MDLLCISVSDILQQTVIGKLVGDGEWREDRKDDRYIIILHLLQQQLQRVEFPLYGFAFLKLERLYTVPVIRRRDRCADQFGDTAFFDLGIVDLTAEILDRCSNSLTCQIT